MRAEVFKLMRFWRDKGVGGFRLDVINLISKPADFPEDNSDAGAFIPTARTCTHTCRKCTAKSSKAMT